MFCICPPHAERQKVSKGVTAIRCIRYGLKEMLGALATITSPREEKKDGDTLKNRGT
jgi:hypothetical protein